MWHLNGIQYYFYILYLYIYIKIFIQLSVSHQTISTISHFDGNYNNNNISYIFIIQPENKLFIIAKTVIFSS